MTLVTNLYAGPGCGKSTVAAHVFAELKWQGVECELVTEYAKDKVWEGTTAILHNQMYVFSKQYQRLWRLQRKVDVVITASPILFSLIYGKEMSPEFIELIKSCYREFNNYDIYLERCKPYNPNGRLQTENEAKILDKHIWEIITENSPNFDVFKGLRENVPDIVTSITDRLGRDGGRRR